MQPPCRPANFVSSPTQKRQPADGRPEELEVVVNACVVCGQAIADNRRRYCGGACRKAAVDARRGARAAAKRVGAALAAGVGVLASTRKAIEGREGETLAQMALNLAARLEACDESPSGTAALNKELRATLAELNVTASKAVDPVDELRARRERRHRSA